MGGNPNDQRGVLMTALLPKAPTSSYCYMDFTHQHIHFGDTNKQTVIVIDNISSSLLHRKVQTLQNCTVNYFNGNMGQNSMRQKRLKTRLCMDALLSLVNLEIEN